MDAGTYGAPVTTRPQLIVTRIVGAPIDLVFAAWKTPEHLAHWWGPAGRSLSSWEIDFRVGGGYRLGVHSALSKDLHVHGTYLEIAESERIVFTWVWEHAGGTLSPQSIVMVRFAPYGHQTRVTLRHAGLASDDVRDEQQTDWEESLARLVAYGRTIRIWPTFGDAG